MDVFVVTFILVFSLTILILSFFIPENTDNKYFKIIMTIRRIMDKICYTFFNIIAFVGLGKGMYDLITSPIDSSNISSYLKRVIGLLGVVMLLYALIYSIKKFISKEK